MPMMLVNILGGSIHTLKENAEALVAATREIGLDISADKTKYMVMSRDQNAGRIHSVRIDNSTFERVEEFKYLGTTLTDQKSIAVEMKSRMRSGNAHTHTHARMHTPPPAPACAHTHMHTHARTHAHTQKLLLSM